MAVELRPEDFELDSIDGTPPYHLKTKDCTAVFFQKPSCPWCQKAKKAWDQFARSCLMDVAKFDASKYPIAVEKMRESGFPLTHYPTFVFYKDGKPTLTHDRNADRTAESFIVTATEHLKSGCSKRTH